MTKDPVPKFGQPAGLHRGSLSYTTWVEAIQHVFIVSCKSTDHDDSALQLDTDQYTSIMAVAVAEPPVSAGSSSQPTSTGEGSTLEVYKRLHPDSYLSRFLSDGYRPDGRTIQAWRDVSINCGA